MKAKMNTCRACGALIVFVPTPKGKMMPCNAKLINYWPTPGGKEKVVTPEGEVVSAEFSGAGDPKVGYITHFATCPKAKKFRKVKK